MKVSIRSSIISLFVLLLSIVGFSIISIQYLALNKILISSAKNYIAQASLLIKERVKSRLSLLSHELSEMKNMMSSDTINPEHRMQLNQFFMEFIKQSPRIFMIYYGTVKGDFFGVDRAKNGRIGLNQIINSTKSPTKVRYEFDEQGQLVHTQVLTTEYDPRTRLWYRHAVSAGRTVWTNVYPFYLFGETQALKSGITTATPLYDEHKQLKGVLAIDTTINSVQNFIQNLRITDHALIFIINENKQIIAYRDETQKDNIRGKIITSAFIKQYHLPFPSGNFQQFKDSASYKVDGEWYFLGYQSIVDKNNILLGQIIIIVPANDILGPLKRVSIHALLLTITILCLGLILVHYISLKISQPITQLTEEAKEITQLDLKPRPLLPTRIKEISDMDSSFMIMRASLTSFQRYVPRSLVKKLMNSGKIATVGGASQTVTVLFSDIKNFTHLSEITPPKLLMDYLSQYFQSMTEIVFKHQGTLDKYIGDAIMAFWNAPSPDTHHALHACQTAVDMIKKIQELNKQPELFLRAADLVLHRSPKELSDLRLPKASEDALNSGLSQLTIRIGIHSGYAVVGNVGSEDRLNFTALGDTINLTSRLEAINKIYQTSIIVSQATFKAVEFLFPFRMLDEVAVRGKQESTIIYELITDQTRNLQQHKEDFAQAFAQYQKGDWSMSLALFETLTPAYTGDKLASIYIARCHALIQSPPAAWDGIWRLSDMDSLL